MEALNLDASTCWASLSPFPQGEVGLVATLTSGYRRIWGDILGPRVDLGRGPGLKEDC